MERLHDFPRLAKESGFAFLTRPKRLDWKILEQIDVEEIACGRQFEELERCLELVLACDLDGDLAKLLDREFVKLFRLSQLGISYLSHCLSYLDRCVVLLQDQLAASLEGNKLQKRARKSREVFECKLCSKTFISESYLVSHSRRRHAPPTTTSATQTEADVARATASSAVQTEQLALVHCGSQTLTNDTRLAATQTEDDCTPINAESKITDQTHTKEADKLEALLDNLVEGLNSRLTAAGQTRLTPADWLSAAMSSALSENPPFFVPFLANCCHQQHVVSGKQSPEPGHTPIAAPRSSIETKAEAEPLIDTTINLAAERRKLLKPHMKTIYSTSESEGEQPPLVTRRKIAQVPEPKPRLPERARVVKSSSSGDGPRLVESKDILKNSTRSGVESQPSEPKERAPNVVESGDGPRAMECSRIVDSPLISVVGEKMEDIGSISSYDSDIATTMVEQPPPTRLAFSQQEPLATSSPAPSPEPDVMQAESRLTAKQIGRPPARRRSPRSSLLSAMKKSPPKVLGLMKRSWTSLYSVVSPSAALNTSSDMTTRLRELHVDPTWAGIPDATLKRSLEALAHNRRLLAKKYPKMMEARRRIEEVLEQRAEAGSASYTPKPYRIPEPQATATPENLPHMYDVESESSVDLSPIEPLPALPQQTAFDTRGTPRELFTEVKTTPDSSKMREKADEKKPPSDIRKEEAESRPAPILKKAASSSSDEATPVFPARLAKTEGKKVMFAENLAEVKKVLFAEDIADSTSSSEWDLTAP